MCTVLTINIFTDFGALFPIFPVQHLHFSFKSFEVVSLVSASSGVFHLIHNEVETFCIRHLNAGEKKISTEKMWNLKRIHAPITIFRHTLELNVEIYFLILNSLFQFYPLKAHREHSYGLWANKFIPPFISSM